MPERTTIQRARRDRREGKAPSTQAGEFVREEIEHIREGKHGARSTKQAIAIGLSKARRAGVDLPPPERGKTSASTRKKARRDYERGRGAPARQRATAKKSSAARKALKREGRKSASHEALSKQAHSAAKRRTRSERSAAAKKAARTKRRTTKSVTARGKARTRGQAAHP
jgi:hypothetical protein